MIMPSPLEPVDYLVIGHLTCDVVPQGLQIGGGACYSALAAKAMGLRVGIFTAWGDELPLDLFENIQVVYNPVERSTTFENIHTPQGRIQYVHHVAPRLDLSLVPEIWKRAPIIHLASVAQEMEAILPEDFRPTLLGLSLQGWLRNWDDIGRVHRCTWQGAQAALEKSGAAVVSMEDVAHDEQMIEDYMLSSRVLAVTEGAAGVRLFWNHDLRRFIPPPVKEVDATGAGDIFAASFFARLYVTRDPWEAARFAMRVATLSVTRKGYDGVPTPKEVQDCLSEIV
jgi:sugar/nucleoside kinase (ribokinase family)